MSTVRASTKRSRDKYLRLTLPWLYAYKECQIPGFIDGIVQDDMENHLLQEPEA